MEEINKRYSISDLSEFKTLIEDKITSSEKDLKRLLTTCEQVIQEISL